jgi:acetoin utilization protein AcuB
MQVGERMKTELLHVSPSDSVRAAWGLLREHQIRHLPVVEDGKLVGIITDRDIRLIFPSAVTAAQRQQDPHDALEKVSVTSETPIADAARLLLERRIGGLPVVEGEHLVGIITKDDILAAFVEVMEAKY